MWPRQDDGFRRFGQLGFGDLENRGVEHFYPRQALGIVPDRLFPPEVLGDGDLRFHQPSDFPSLARRHRVVAAGDRHQENVDLAHHLELLGREHMAQIAQMGDAQGAEIENLDQLLSIPN